MRNCFLLRVLAAVCVCSASDALSEESFSEIYIYGDSLSDTGNLLALGTPEFKFLNERQLPYDRGFSNGPRGVEVLAEELGLDAAPSFIGGTNFAISGARAGGESSIDLNTQIGAFFSTTIDIAAPNTLIAPSEALYVLFIGANDVRDARDEIQFGQSLRIIGDAVTSIDEAIRTLIGAGAKSFMVVNAPDVRVLPETEAIAEATNLGFLPRRATLLTRIFNARLLRRLNQIEQDLQIDLIHVDLFALFEFTIENSAALGFANVTDACFSSVALAFNPDCDFGKYLFFDEFHPTARAHERIGRSLLTFVPAPITDLE